MQELVDNSKAPVTLYQLTDDIVAFLVKTLQPGDHVLIMSNGGFDSIHTKLLKQLGAQNA
jgi:UDP-N-acetylmuramate: L-alanyl-gamma-D-glutamyl-meso-diaminopimelate ligase